MVAIFYNHNDELAAEFEQWVTLGRPLPLEVTRSRYDDNTLSWEVLYTDTPWDGNGGCSTPIAEFTTWQEAQDWAVLEARKSRMTADNRRTLGPMTEEQQWRHDAWASWRAFEGEHPYRIEHLAPGAYGRPRPRPLSAAAAQRIAEDEARRGVRP